MKKFLGYFPKDTVFFVWFFIALYLLFSMVSISLIQIALSLAFLCWLILHIKQKKWPRFPPFFWPLLIYCVLSLLSSFRSVNPKISLTDSRELLLFFIVPITFTAITSEKGLKKANYFLLISACANALYALFTYFFLAEPGERITGFMGHWMTQAGLLLLFCSFALSLFLLSKNRLRFLWACGGVLGTIALMLTLTRSAWIGLAFAATLVLAFYKPKTLILIPVAISLFFLLSPQHVKRRALSIFSTRQYSNAQRIEYFRAGIQIIKENPIFGTGPSTVDMVFQNPKYGLSELAKRNVHLHNNIIQIGAERGIPTLLAWLVFIGWAFLSLLKLLRDKNPILRPVTVGALAALVGLFVAGLFEYNFGDSEITVLFLFLITIPFTLVKINRIGSREN
ncbi:MAG: O-antigen ligase family protein [Candidatus Aminicenantes bacterium]|nr:MAG: O-antigen ligase family protein [Candidatus Aminicenantes bacterium]